ncbi:MAG: thioredoxin family protein [Myxococcales bacterium]|nr:thioredoxin family protein [Polyangiaceae bacterium]MDW8250454.1 thioredoxin family protein [Myxococcales bacterium]
MANIFYHLGLAFLGGLVLNVMPCVLPVLTLKAFYALDHAHKDRSEQRKVGLGYILGTSSAMLVFGGVVLAIRASGKAMGWGMQFQHPGFVAALIAVIVGFALNALGVFEIFVSGHQEEHEGFLGSVANGWFAAVMATPCSAPFLGAAATYALAADTPPALTLLLFATIGVGLAAPFAALSFIPALGNRLPRPGPWMETFKHLMGFSLLATAVWLFGTLARQITPNSLQLFLAFLLALSFGLWAMQRFAGLEASSFRRWSVRCVIFLALAVGWKALPLEKQTAKHEASASGEKLKWVEFDPKHIEAMLAQGKPVFLDFTADWCSSCKVNDKLFVDTEPVRAALARTGVVPIKVDMTSQDDDVKDEWLKRTGRNDLPVYVVLLPDGSMDLLPVVITSEMLVSAFERAVQKKK